MSTTDKKDRKSKRRFDRVFLDECILRDEATLLANEDSYEHLIRKSTIHFTCKCGKESTKEFVYLADRSGAFCKDCSRKNKLNKFKESCLEKYGVEHVSQSKEIMKKAKETMKERYGVEHALQNKEIYSKAKETFKEKYGTEHPMKSDAVKKKAVETTVERYGVDNVFKLEETRKKAKETMKERFGVEHAIQSDVLKQKIAQTNLSRYGVENVFESSEFQARAKETMLSTYGVENAIHCPEIRAKITETNKERLGVEFPFQSQSVQEKVKDSAEEMYGHRNVFQNCIVQAKSKQTMMERYNVPYSMQSQEIQEKAQKSSLSYKKYTTPSGQVRNVQGFEPNALDTLFKEHNLEESDVTTDRASIPRIPYTFNEKQCYYFPDIYIKSLNKLIEVKSTWTYEKDKAKNEAKAAAAKSVGYLFEFWVYTSKAKSLTIHVI
jgi:hypothetical protein